MKRRVEILRSLKCQVICISMYNFCELLDDTNCIELTELSNHQEEADTKVCLHAINALNEDPNKNVIIIIVMIMIIVIVSFRRFRYQCFAHFIDN